MGGEPRYGMLMEVMPVYDLITAMTSSCTCDAAPNLSLSGLAFE